MTRSCWGIYRELAHSPGRETDDAEILQATAAELSARGFAVTLKSPDELPAGGRSGRAALPLRHVRAHRRRREARGLGKPRSEDRQPAVGHSQHRPGAHDRALRRGRRASSVERPRRHGCRRAPPFRARAGSSAATSMRPRRATSPTPATRRRSPRTSRACPRGASAARSCRTTCPETSSSSTASRDYPTEAEAEDAARPSWFQWFYHRDQKLENHAFDEDALAAATSRAAAALGLEVYGGDAIVSPAGAISVIDLNAWPSFALFRSVAAAKIAALLAARFSRAAVAIGASR